MAHTLDCCSLGDRGPSDSLVVLLLAAWVALHVALVAAPEAASVVLVAALEAHPLMVLRAALTVLLDSKRLKSEGRYS